jgi:hypothetical protein
VYGGDHHRRCRFRGVEKTDGSVHRLWLVASSAAPVHPQLVFLDGIAFVLVATARCYVNINYGKYKEMEKQSADIYFIFLYVFLLKLKLKTSILDY